MLLAAYPERGSAYRIGALVLFAAAAVILTALAFEHFGGYVPCPLCLQQRYAYYTGVPALFFALVLLSAGHTRTAAAVFLAVALIFLANAVLGAYHTGVEWKFWPGPTDCSGPVVDLGSAGTLLQRLDSVKVIRCDEVQWRFLGLSLAGYNVLISLLMAVMAVWGIVSAKRA